jgi:hypothetical protein
MTAESVITTRLDAPEFSQLLTATPGGLNNAIRLIYAEIGRFDSTPDLAGHIQICLLAQIDAVWWGTAPCYERDPDVARCPVLTDVAQTALVRYRRQSDRLALRAVRTAERLLVPARTPDPVGLRFARARAEVAELIEQLAAEFGRSAPPGTPPLWITSLTRSVEHQQRLRSLGYAAMLPSSHCTGYSVDVAMSWYRRYGADSVLSRLLLDRCAAGQLNVIGGDQTWHVCLSPAGAAELRRERARRIGG